MIEQIAFYFSTFVLSFAELSSSFEIIFDKIGIVDYILMDDINNNLTEVTISFWMKTTDTENYGTPVSYATSKYDNALTLTDYSG